ncbi:MAG: PAS domain S-box-containing protein [Hyphomicrobiaceae bacterium]|jgi:PAS domain S-box-containing protein
MSILAALTATLSLALHAVAAVLAFGATGRTATQWRVLGIGIVASGACDVFALTHLSGFVAETSLVSATIVSRLVLATTVAIAVWRGLRIKIAADDALENAAILEASTARAERRWRIMFEQAPDGYLLMDLDGTLRLLNKAGENLSGWSAEDAIGKTVFELGVFAEEQLQEAAAEFVALAAGQSAGPTRYRLQRRDGSRRDIESLAYPVELDGQTQVLTIFRDRTHEEQTQRALASTRARLAEGQGLAHLNTWEFDIDQDRIWFSSSVDKLYDPLVLAHGPTMEQAVAVIDENDRARVLASLREAIAGRLDVVTEEYLQHTPTGETLRIRMKARPDRDESGRIVRLLGASQNVSEIREVEKEIWALNARLERRVAERTAELQRAVSELEAFSYSVSHDLRTPLRTIAGFADLLRDKERDRLDPESIDWLSRIRSSAVRLAGMIDALLQLSRLTRVEPQWGSVDLAAIANEIMEELRSGDVEREVKMATLGEPEELLVHGDKRLLRVVMQNLLSNSWKFTHGVEDARIELGSSQSKEGQAWFVRDNGAGFDERHADKLFQPFQRLHGVHEFEGSGIGLATVARIIQRHGGRIWAEGKLRRGATFWFTLGARDAEQAISGEPKLAGPTRR